MDDLIKAFLEDITLSRGDTEEASDAKELGDWGGEIFGGSMMCFEYGEGNFRAKTG